MLALLSSSVVDRGMEFCYQSHATLLGPVLRHPDLTLWQLLRCGNGRSNFVPFEPTPVAAEIRTRLAEADGLRTLSRICMVLAADDGSDCMRFLLTDSCFYPNLADWPPDLLWPYFTQHFALIDEALGLAPPSGKWPLSEARALGLLALFPLAPARYRAALLDRAIGDRKLVRQPARDLLTAAPGLDGFLIPLLDHTRAETRIAAANWLAERNASTALPALLQAAAHEKQPAARAAMLSAVSLLGGDSGEFFSHAALLKDAQAGMKKAGANWPSWLPTEALPAVRGRDGTVLDPDILRWWITLGIRMREAGGNPWIDLLLEQCDPEDAGRLGLTILQAWVAFDTAHPSDEDANTYAAENIDSTLASYQRWQPDATREPVFAMLRRQKLSEYFNSGTNHKGALACASRAPGANAVAIVKAYFRDHYARTAQCKALLSCLAANPSPLATQYVLTIARRWRTRSVQELAGELVRSIAERRSWSADQLADRTVPTGGFDDDGVLALPIGDKLYAACLDAAGRILLQNPDGKAVKSLPASVPEETAAALKEARALLATARKEVKQVFDQQTSRLAEALCVERVWPLAEWQEHLLRHPLMARLAQRLIWTGLNDAGQQTATFRPLGDLSLTDAADHALHLDGTTQIRLAHASRLSAAEIAAWNTHLTDYEIEPLFDQLNRPHLAPGDGPGEGTEITDRKGWLIETFKLRTIAPRLGYTRGAAKDGGWFNTYEKRFAGLQLVTIIEFSGNTLPEENRLSALVALRIARMGQNSLNWKQHVPLKSVPPVLLSEAWNDFHRMAAAGSGFDPAWEKKVQAW